MKKELIAQSLPNVPKTVPERLMGGMSMRVKKYSVARHLGP